MADAGSLLDLDGEVFSLHSLDADHMVSQECVSPHIVSRAHGYVRVLRTTERASVSIVLTTKVIAKPCGFIW